MLSDDVTPSFPIIGIIYMYLTLKNDKIMCMYFVLQNNSLYVYLNILYTTLEIKRNSLVQFGFLS